MKISSEETKEAARRSRTLPKLIPDRVARISPREVVLAAVVVYGIVMAFLSIYKHEIFASSRFDLGNMDQAVWNSSEGRILQATDENGELTSRLRNHADFLLLLFVPLYLIYASPYWLLIVQALVVGLGALPLFWLARRFTSREWVSALISIAYLFNPGLQSANLFDFHAQTLAPTFLLFAFHYLLEKRLLPFLLFAVLAAMTKEGIVLIAGMMGVYVLLVERRPVWGIPVVLGSVGYFLLTMLVIIPAFNTGDTSGLVEERYGVFGGSLGGVARTFLTEPLFTASYLFGPERWEYFVQLLGMTGFVGLLAPHMLVIPVSEMGINLLSEKPQMTDFNYHYSAPIIPFTYLAAAVGLLNFVHLLRSRPGRRFLGRFAPRPPALSRIPLVLSVGILLLGVQMDFDYGPLPIFHSESNYRSVIDPTPPEHRRALDEAVALVPDDAKVSATNNIGPHLAHRRYLYLFPTVKDAEYVVLDETKPGYDTQIEPVLSLQSTQKLRRSGEFEEIYASEGVVVFRRR